MSLPLFTFKIQQFTQHPSEACIFIGKVSEDQMHCGIVYDDPDNGNFNTLHLAWHHDLHNDQAYADWMSKYHCVESKVHHIRLGMIPAMCTRIIERKQFHNIPYGLLFDGGTFIEDDGIIKVGVSSSGLTCATFVMAVFASCRINLIDINTWKPRRTDKYWHKKIISGLENTKHKYNISDEHINNVRKELGCARFRPEEVAVSSFFKKPPKNSYLIRIYGRLLSLTLKK